MWFVVSAGTLSTSGNLELGYLCSNSVWPYRPTNRLSTQGGCGAPQLCSVGLEWEKELSVENEILALMTSELPLCPF